MQSNLGKINLLNVCSVCQKINLSMTTCQLLISLQIYFFSTVYGNLCWWFDSFAESRIPGLETTVPIPQPHGSMSLLFPESDFSLVVLPALHAISTPWSYSYRCLLYYSYLSYISHLFLQIQWPLFSFLFSVLQDWPACMEWMGSPGFWLLEG